MLSRIELVNSIVALLSIDFHALEQDVKKEQQLRQKVKIILIKLLRYYFYLYKYSCKGTITLSIIGR